MSSNYAARGSTYGRRGGAAPSRRSSQAQRPTDLNDRGFASRFVADIGSMLVNLPRALGTMVGAVGSDTVMRLGRAAVPGGSTGFDYGVQSWDHLVKPIGESVGGTLSLLGAAAGAPVAALTPDGRDRLGEIFGEAREEFREHPGLFAIEHVGNVALTGAAVSRPLAAGARTSAGVERASTAAGLKGRQGRAANRAQLSEIAESGGPGADLARAARLSGDIVGHPYVQAGRRVADARMPALFGAQQPHTLREVTQQVREAMPADRMVWTPEQRDAATLRGLRDEVDAARVSGDDTAFAAASTRLGEFEAANAGRLETLEAQRLAPPTLDELSSPVARSIRAVLNSERAQPLTKIGSTSFRETKRMVQDLKERRTETAFETLVARDPSARRNLAIRQLRDLSKAEGVDLSAYGIELPRGLDRRAGAAVDQQLYATLRQVADTPELRQKLPNIDGTLELTILDLYERINGLPDGALRNQLVDEATLTPAMADTARRLRTEDLPPEVRHRVDEALGQQFRVPDEQLANPISAHPEIADVYQSALTRLTEQAAQRDLTLASEGLGNPETWAMRVADDGAGGRRAMTPDETPDLVGTPSRAQARQLRSAGRRVGVARRTVEDVAQRAEDRNVTGRVGAYDDYRRAARSQRSTALAWDRARRAGDEELAAQLRSDLDAARERTAATRAEARQDVYGQTQRAQRALEAIVRSLSDEKAPVGASEALGPLVREAREALDAAFARSDLEPPRNLARSIDELEAAAVDISATDVNALDNLIRLAEASPDDLTVWRDAVAGGQDAVRGSTQARANVNNVERIIRAEERAKAEMRQVRSLERRLENAEGRLEARDPEVLRAAREALDEANADLARVAEEAGVQTSAPRTPGEHRKLEDRLLREQTRAVAEQAELTRAVRAYDRVEAKFAELEAELMSSVEAAPAVARPALTFARAASELDGVFREAGLTQLADDLALTQLPTTLERMAEAGVSPVFLRRLEERLGGGTGYRSAQESTVSTPTMTAQRRRTMEDMDVTRDLDRVKAEADIELAGRVLTGDMIDTFLGKFGHSMDNLGQSMIDRGILSREAWRDMSKAQRERLLSQNGYNTYNPDQIFSFRVRKTGDDAAWVPTHLNEALRDYTRPGALERMLTGVLQPATTAWKHTVLALRPAWHVYNIVGNAAMAMLGGRVGVNTYAEMMKPGSDARQLLRENRLGWNLERFGLDAEQAHILLEGGLTRDLLPDARVRRALDEGYRAPESMRRVLDSQIGQRGSGAWQATRRGTNRVTGASYRANAYMDNLNRATVYLDSVRTRGLNPEDAVRHANRVLGDYRHMTPAEKVYLRSIFPFYAWMRHITRLTGDMLRPDNITRTAMIGTVVETMGEPEGMEALFPEYMAGDLIVPGTEWALGMRGLNPWQDVLDVALYNDELSTRGAMRSMHPLIQFGVERQTGIDTLTGRPFSRPSPVLDDLGREIPTAPGIREHAFARFAPPQAQLGRNLLRKATGQTTSRYSTGEPVLLEGAREPNLFAGVSGYMGIPLRDTRGVPEMQERRDLAMDRVSRQIERYRAETEQYEQRRAQRSLPERLLPFGG